MSVGGSDVSGYVGKEVPYGTIHERLHVFVACACKSSVGQATPQDVKEPTIGGAKKHGCFSMI